MKIEQIPWETSTFYQQHVFSSSLWKQLFRFSTYCSVSMSTLTLASISWHYQRIMDDPLIIFRGSSFFQLSDIHRIQKKTFPVRFMTNKNLFNLSRSKILTKIQYLWNLFLHTISTTNIDIFGYLEPGKFQTSNSRQFFRFFRDTPKFFS